MEKSLWSRAILSEPFSQNLLASWRKITSITSFLAQQILDELIRSFPLDLAGFRRWSTVFKWRSNLFVGTDAEWHLPTLLWFCDTYLFTIHRACQSLLRVGRNSDNRNLFSIGAVIPKYLISSRRFLLDIGFEYLFSFRPPEESKFMGI